MKWTEDRGYSRARNPKLGVRYHVTLYVFLLAASLLFSFGLWAFAGYKAKVAVVIIVSFALPLILQPILLRAFRGPKTVIVAEQAVEINGEKFGYSELTSVRLGHVIYEDTEYPVASFVVRDEYDVVIGLPNDGYFDTLESALKMKGLNVER